MGKLLVFCTGNYYRSRFVEKYFNQLASKEGLPWRAESRGIALWEGVLNEGPISKFTVSHLKKLGIAIDADERMPLPMTEEDLSGADLILGIHEEKHEPLLAEQFPHWLGREHIRFWTIADIDQLTPAVALTALQEQVEVLVGELATKRTSSA